MARKTKKAPSFKFWKLPRLVMESIAYLISIPDQIDLSLCPDNSEAPLRLTRCPLKMDIRLGTKTDRLILYKNEKNEENSIRWYFSKYRKIKTSRMIHGGNIFTKKMPAKINRKTNKMMKSIGYHSFSSGKYEHTINTIISHIFLLFPRCEVVDLYVNLYNDFNIKTAISSLSVVQNLRVYEHDYGVGLKSILEKVNVTKRFENGCRSFRGTIDDNLNCSDELISYDSTWISPQTFLRLNCKRVKLLRTGFNTEDMMQFLKKWKNSTGDDMKNIKVVEIEHPSGIEPLDFQSLEARPFDSTRRANRFEFEDFHVDCSDGFDIERNDGLVGTIVDYLPNSKCFVVWH